MGGQGSGRPTKEAVLVRDTMRLPEPTMAFPNALIVPNRSGDHAHGTILAVPTKDEDLVNKKYCDSNKTSITWGDITASGAGVTIYNGAKSVSGAVAISVAGAPGGSDTQVQFNDGGAFGGDAGLVYNKSTDVLTTSGGVITPQVGNANKQLTMYETGDQYGDCYLYLRNRGGANGALFQTANTAVNLVDFGFKPGSQYQSNIRCEGRSVANWGVICTLNDGLEEFQFVDNSTSFSTPKYNYPFVFGRYGAVFYPYASWTDNFTGNVGISVNTPTARLHLPEGSATANTAPLKFTSGALLTTAEVGAMEFALDDLYLTSTTSTTRRKIGGSGFQTPVWYPVSDSTTALKINKADGTTNVLNVDSTNARIGIGTTIPTQLLTLSGGNLLLVSGGILYIPGLKKIDGTTSAADGDSLKFEASTGRIYGG